MKHKKRGNFVSRSEPLKNDENERRKSWKKRLVGTKFGTRSKRFSFQGETQPL